MYQNLVIVELKGTLTLVKTEQSLSQIKQSIKAQTGNLLLDLGQLGFVDSAGLAVLVRIHKLTNSMGIRMALCTLPVQVNQLLHLSGMFDFFEIFDSREDFYQNWSSQFPAGSSFPTLAAIPVVTIATE